MSPFVHALALAAAVIGIGLTVLGALAGTLAAITVDDRHVQKAAIAVAALSLALFIPIAAQISELVLR